MSRRSSFNSSEKNRPQSQSSDQNTKFQVKPGSERPETVQSNNCLTDRRSINNNPTYNKKKIVNFNIRRDSPQVSISNGTKNPESLNQNSKLIKNKNAHELGLGIGFGVFNLSDLKNKDQAFIQKNINTLIIDKTTTNPVAMIVKCAACHECIDKIFKTSRCSEHNYCEPCIKNKPKAINCNNCIKYFDYFKAKNVSPTYCSLCGSPKHFLVPNCNAHGYCKPCSEYLSKNNFNHIEKLNNCKVCKSYYIKQGHQEENKVPESHRPKLKASTKYLEDSKNHGTKILHYNSSYYSQPAATSNTFNCCLNNSSKKFKTPRCTDHEYCTYCFSDAKNNPNCALCNMYFESLKEKNIDTYKCSLCKLPPITSDIKCTSHSYCEYCYYYLENNEYNHIINVARCPECDFFLKQIKDAKVSNQNKYQDDFLTIQAKQNSIKSPERQSRTKVQGAHSARGVSANPHLGAGGFSDQHLRIRCAGCYSYSDKSLKTPRCTKHEYCSKCIDRGPGYVTCDLCIMYFESLTKKLDPSIFACSLCKIAPMSSDLKCKLHSYCKYCFEFLITNDFSHLKNVSKCQDCISFLNNVKNKNAPLSVINQKPELNPKILNSNEYSNEPPNQKFNSKSNLGNSNNEKFNNFQTELVVAYFNQDQFKAKIGDSRQNFNNPQYSNQPIPVKPGVHNPVHSPRSQFLNPQPNYEITPEKPNSNYPYFSTRPIKNQFSNPQPTYETTAARPNSHDPSHSRPQINKFSDPQPTYETTPARPNSYNPSCSRPQIDQNLEASIPSNLLARCSQCFGGENIKGFLCDHNICMSCLVKMCCSQISLFIVNYISQNPTPVYSFYFYCTTNTCNKKISVPTRMILNNLRKLLNNPYHSPKFEEFRYLINPGYLQEDWITYFDGLIIWK